MDKVMFCNGDFMRKFRKYNGQSQHMTTELKSIFAHDIVLVPFFFEEPERGNMSTWNSAEASETPHQVYGSKNLGTVLVVIQVFKNQTLAIDLYKRLSRDSQIPDEEERGKLPSKVTSVDTLISEEIIKVLTVAADLGKVSWFSQDNIDGAFE